MAVKTGYSSSELRVFDMFKHCVSELRQRGIENADKEAEIILTEGIGIERVSFYRDNPVLREGQLKTINGIIKRRTLREPLQYILGYADFYGMRFKVGPGVLIPRPETELVINEAVKRLKGKHSQSVLDIGTGSGCIAIALARQIPDAVVYAVDASEKALRYAEDNKQHYKIKNLTLIKSHVFESLDRIKFDIIVSNPPYIKSSIIEGLQPEVKDWEPHEALDGKQDGLSFYREILINAPHYLNPGGLVILEIGDGQAGDVGDIAVSAGFKMLSKTRDYSGIERVLAFRAN